METKEIAKIAAICERTVYNCVRGENASYDAVFLPTGSENRQLLMVNDYMEYTIKLYTRQRKDKVSEWGEWKIAGTLSLENK
jgi:hypothetical protein